MDGQSFDRFARNLVTVRPRRRVLTAIVGRALGSLLARFGQAEAACVRPGGGLRALRRLLRRRPLPQRPLPLQERQRLPRLEAVLHQGQM